MPVHNTYLNLKKNSKTLILKLDHFQDIACRDGTKSLQIRVIAKEGKRIGALTDSYHRAKVIGAQIVHKRAFKKG